jgi:hypothetical protein
MALQFSWQTGCTTTSCWHTDCIGISSCPELGLTFFVEGVMSAVEKQTETTTSAWMVENSAAFADFLLLKEHI